jgi:hypothetical protein
MGIYTQPNAWLCGPFALKHALLLLGIRADEHELAALAGTTEEGTDEEELARAAGRFGCTLGTSRYMDAESCHRALMAYVADGIPTLLCIEQWDHWVTAAHEDDGTFVILDSRHPAVFRLLPWEYLRKLLVFHPGSGSATKGIYDLHPLVAPESRRLKPALTVSRARFVEAWEHRNIARDWVGLLDDALEFAEQVTDDPDPSRSLSPGAFFGRHEPDLLDAVSATNDALQRSRARIVLRALRFIADVYGLAIPAASEREALDRVRAIMRRRMGCEGTAQ